MTVLGLRVCHRANGVSALHGRVSRRMWRPLWENRDERVIPIGHITNGVHVLSWLAPRMARLFDRYLGDSWHLHMTEPQTWEGVSRSLALSVSPKYSGTYLPLGCRLTNT